MGIILSYFFLLVRVKQLTGLIIFFTTFQDLALKMSDTATEELVNALNDPEEPLTPEVEEAAVGVAGVLKNVLKSSSGTSQATGLTPADSSSSKVQTIISVLRR